MAKDDKKSKSIMQEPKFPKKIVKEVKKPKEKKKETEEKTRNTEEKKGKKKEKEEKTKNMEEKKEDKKKEKRRERKEKKKEEAAKSEIQVLVDKDNTKEMFSNKKAFIKKFYTDELDGKKLMQDFLDLRSQNHCVAEVTKKHPNKCRYYDIMAPDATRVILLDRPPENDFIHANYMTMPNGYKYISAQGPMEETTEDFWHMVYMEKSPAIVMICDFIEDDIEKCTRYIPLETVESRNFGQYKITRVGEPTMVFEDVRLQNFLVINEKNADKPAHRVKHYQYLNWPDHTAPMSTSSVLKLVKALKEPTMVGAPIIHCSAGIGRTATFIGADYGAQRAGQSGASLDVLDLVREMRKMRDKAVQSHHQFIFMIICFTDALVAEGCKRNEDMDYFLEFYRDFMECMRKRREEKKKKEAEDKKKEKEKKEKEVKEKVKVEEKKEEKKEDKKEDKKEEKEKVKEEKKEKIDSKVMQIQLD